MSDSTIILIIAAVAIVATLIFIMVFSRRNKAKTDYEPPHYGPETPPSVPRSGSSGSPSASAGSPYSAPGGYGSVSDYDGLTVGGSLPVDHRFHSVSYSSADRAGGKMSGSAGSAAESAAGLKKGRFGSLGEPEKKKKDKNSEEVVELYMFRHDPGVRICPFCDSENKPGSAVCNCCGSPLTS